MFLCSLIEELCTKEENDKTRCNFNFGHESIIISLNMVAILRLFKNKEKVFEVSVYPSVHKQTFENTFVLLLKCRGFFR